MRPCDVNIAVGSRGSLVDWQAKRVAYVAFTVDIMCSSVSELEFRRSSSYLRGRPRRTIGVRRRTTRNRHLHGHPTGSLATNVCEHNTQHEHTHNTHTFSISPHVPRAPRLLLTQVAKQQFNIPTCKHTQFLYESLKSVLVKVYGMGIRRRTPC